MDGPDGEWVRFRAFSAGVHLSLQSNVNAGCPTGWTGAIRLYRSQESGASKIGVMHWAYFGDNSPGVPSAKLSNWEASTLAWSLGLRGGASHHVRRARSDLIGLASDPAVLAFIALMEVPEAEGMERMRWALIEALVIARDAGAYEAAGPVG